MGKLQDEQKRAQINGDQPRAGFSGTVNNAEAAVFEAGDVFTIPSDFTDRIFSSKIPNTKREAEYLLVDMENGDVKRFYPSTFTKRRQYYDEDKMPTGKYETAKGTAVDKFKSKVDVNEAMEQFKGLKLKITQMTKVRTLRWGTADLTDAYVPTIDIVEEEKKSGK